MHVPVCNIYLIISREGISGEPDLVVNAQHLPDLFTGGEDCCLVADQAVVKPGVVDNQAEGQGHPVWLGHKVRRRDPLGPHVHGLPMTLWTSSSVTSLFAVSV